MAKRVGYSNYPWWVKLSLLGVNSRTGQWFFVVLSLACAVGSVIYGFRDYRFFGIAIAFVLATLMYWLTIRWVDHYGSWTNDTETHTDPDSDW